MLTIYAGIPGRRELVDKILRALEDQRKQHVQQIATIDMARAIYIRGMGIKTVGKKRGKRTMSAATKRKLSLAAKARWARVKKG